MKKKIVFVSLMVVTFFLGWGVIADQHINAAVHYTHQWKYPVPVQLKNEELADSGKLHYKLYTSTGHLKRIWKVSKNYGALLNAGSYYPLAEATIRGKKFYKVYRYNFKPEREDEKTYWGWMRTNDFSSYKKTKYQDEPIFTTRSRHTLTQTFQRDHTQALKGFQTVLLMHIMRRHFNLL
ncbi:hypothetical protein [Lentilactobacillus parafarraginis]|uniref:hypothetical protein n=1 Tax=Lentilactobacillus parafarraginis TaxID=390842 RepID=UPI0006CFFE86|nr:hypothetical protein [Lentilactobacillus parafarraginis]